MIAISPSKKSSAPMITMSTPAKATQPAQVVLLTM
jgi:hypothetical protein